MSASSPFVSEAKLIENNDGEGRPEASASKSKADLGPKPQSAGFSHPSQFLGAAGENLRRTGQRDGFGLLISNPCNFMILQTDSFRGPARRHVLAINLLNKVP